MGFADTSRRWAARLWACGVLLCGACGTSDAGSGPGGDGGAASATVELGTGQDDFVPFEDGETLALHRGTQGLQHVFVSLRTRGLEPRGVLIDLGLTRDRDGARVSVPFEVRLSVSPVDGEDYAKLAGLIVVVEFPEEALDEELTLEARLTDGRDRVATASRPVQVDWAP